MLHEREGDVRLAGLVPVCECGVKDQVSWKSVSIGTKKGSLDETRIDSRCHVGDGAVHGGGSILLHVEQLHASGEGADG